MQGHGLFKGFVQVLEELAKEFKYNGVYIECVSNDRITRHLTKAGYRELKEYQRWRKGYGLPDYFKLLSNKRSPSFAWMDPVNAVRKPERAPKPKKVTARKGCVL